MKKPKPARTRLSLEPTAEFVAELDRHAKDLGEWSRTATIRRAVRRSAWLWRRGVEVDGDK